MTVAELRKQLTGACPVLAQILEEGAISVNGSVVPDSQLLMPLDEVEVITPNSND